MKIYIELKSGKYIESTLWIERLEESLFQLLNVVKSFYQVDPMDIRTIYYSPVRTNKAPHSIISFKGSIDNIILNSAKAKYKLENLESE